jgi:hypothetical protein
MLNLNDWNCYVIEYDLKERKTSRLDCFKVREVLFEHPSPLKICPEGKIRYIHLLANNTKWVEVDLPRSTEIKCSAKT